MNPQKQHPRDLFDGDPDFGHEYPQDFIKGLHTPLLNASLLIPFALFALTFTYQILFTLDYDLLPIPELLWNGLVHLIPSRLIDAIETYTNPLRIKNPQMGRVRRSRAMKSRALRRFLKLENSDGILNKVRQAGRRRLSNIPRIGMRMPPQGEEGQPPGLGNWDNSCYQNSVLQGLASLDSLAGYLRNLKIDGESGEIIQREELQMADALRGLIDTLNDPLNNGKRLWTPPMLKSMSSWQQQDAQEYFSKVLDEIDKETEKVARLTRRSSQGLEVDAPSTKSRTNTVPVSNTRNPLEGLIAQRVGCTTCGYSEGLSMIPFNCLTVPLGESWEYNVSECLDEYTNLEQIEGVECGKCTLLKTQRMLSTIFERVKDTPEDTPIRKTTAERLEAVSLALEEDDYEDKTLRYKCKILPKNRVSSTKSRQAVIARPPKSLTVHFNRSLFDELTGELKKNYAEVRFPIKLDLGPWCLGSSGVENEPSTEEWILNPEVPMIASSAHPSRLQGPMYELRAVVTHYGRHENGHYICYKKHPNSNESAKGKDQWWRLSDDDVMKVTEDNVLQQGGVFMLFYDLIETTTSISSELAPTPAIEEANVSELELAAGIPLPDFDDANLSDSDQDSILTTQEESIATSISEYDDDEDSGINDSNYEPTKAIYVPAFVAQSGVHDNGEESRRQRQMSSSNLVMV
ncbi:hypothetical protein B7494_g1063 [Chlorociboria aeruginascens]|nr:hypothetical protein B7494_g1063 [Chlorociboria aeruginascens]